MIPQSVMTWPIPFMDMWKRSPGPILSLVGFAASFWAAYSGNELALGGWVFMAVCAVIATRWQQYAMNLNDHLSLLVEVSADTSAEMKELTEACAQVIERCNEHDPTDGDAARDFYGHIIPAVSRMASVVRSKSYEQ
jgi:hypothetical protein